MKGVGKNPARTASPPKPRGPAGPSLLDGTIRKPRREREKLIGEICERLARDLDGDVVALRRLVREIR